MGIILPKQVLASQDLKAGLEVNVAEVRGTIVLSKNEYNMASSEVLRLADEVAHEYDDVFRKLAKK